MPEPVQISDLRISQSGGMYIKLVILKGKENPKDASKKFWKDVGSITLFFNEDGTVRGDMYLHFLDGSFLLKSDKPREEK
jgi:hypothetical protein